MLVTSNEGVNGWLATLDEESVYDNQAFKANGQGIDFRLSSKFVHLPTWYLECVSGG